MQAKKSPNTTPNHACGPPREADANVNINPKPMNGRAKMPRNAAAAMDPVRMVSRIISRCYYEPRHQKDAVPKSSVFGQHLEGGLFTALPPTSNMKKPAHREIFGCGN
jgi:hypothetical protein